MAFEQTTGVFQVFLGVGGRSRHSRKRLIQNGYDALLFLKRWQADVQCLQFGVVNRLMNRSACKAQQTFLFRQKEVDEKTSINLVGANPVCKILAGRHW